MLRRPDREIPQALLHHTGIEILRQRMAAALLRRGVTIDNAGVAVRIEEPDHLITNALDRRGIRQSIKEVDKPRQHFPALPPAVPPDRTHSNDISVFALGARRQPGPASVS
jgi:hypothetical protein